MTCLSITQWSLPNFYSLQGRFCFAFTGDMSCWAGGDSLITCAEGDKHIAYRLKQH